MPHISLQILRKSAAKSVILGRKNLKKVPRNPVGTESACKECHKGSLAPPTPIKHRKLHNWVFLRYENSSILVYLYAYLAKTLIWCKKKNYCQDLLNTHSGKLAQKRHGHSSVMRLTLLQGSPTLLLKSYHPADFSSNPNQTHLNQLIKVCRATW